jgi:curli biogenesis system outer membrane secretion channel CsgG
MSRSSPPRLVGAAVACSLVALGACAPTTGLSYTMTRMPRQPGTCSVNPSLTKLGVHTLAVLPFEAPDNWPVDYWTSPAGDKVPRVVFYDNPGDFLSGVLETEVAASFKFRVVDRQKVKEVAKELAFQGSELVDMTTAATIGNMLGADALVTGKVKHVMSTLVAVADSSGNSMSFYQAAVAFRVKVIHVATGQILAVCEKEADTSNFLEKDLVITADNVRTDYARVNSTPIAKVLAKEFVDLLPKVE